MGSGWRLEVAAGMHARRGCPLDLAAPAGLAEGPYTLRPERGDAPLCGVCSGGRFLTVLPALAAGEAVPLTLEPAAAPRPGGPALEARPEAVHVSCDGRPRTALRLQGVPKPCLHPLLAPGGVSVVRGWPLAPEEGDSTDHPHHRGAWVGHGDLNGADTWEERPGRGGSIAVDSVSCVTHPGVAAEIRLELGWLRHDGVRAARERRTYRFWAGEPSAPFWCFDQESEYLGEDGGPLRFGDTKEGALCGLRVATGMEGAAGGRIRTAEGARGEAEAWGSAAGWCDYSGEPRHGGGATVGAAIFDHPGNALHPARWHVRDYGLLACNPFALSHYLPGQGRRGDLEVPAGTPAAFRFRVCVHQGDAEAAAVADRYADYAFPPRARWVAV